jgi:hypothetical protein
MIDLQFQAMVSYDARSPIGYVQIQTAKNTIKTRFLKNINVSYKISIKYTGILLFYHMRLLDAPDLNVREIQGR